MLSGASPLFDNKQVFISWIHLYVCFFAGKPRFSASLLFAFAWTRPCRLPQPSGELRSALFFWELLWFFKPLFILSFASTSGKIIGFIQYDLPARSPGGGHRPLWSPWFHTAGAFLEFDFFSLEWWTLGFTVVIEKDVFVFVMADFLPLLWWFLSWKIGRTGGEMAVHLQIWEDDKQNSGCIGKLYGSWVSQPLMGVAANLQLYWWRWAAVCCVWFATTTVHFAAPQLTSANGALREKQAALGSYSHWPPNSPYGCTCGLGKGKVC